MNWGKAFLEQAKSDMEVFNSWSATSNIPACHKLHYLQMTTEKMAKVHPQRSRWNDKPVENHAVLESYLIMLKTRVGRSIRKRLKFHNEYGQYSHHAFNTYIESLLPIAKKIQDLVPSQRHVPANPEYPWEDETPTINAPCHHTFAEILEDKHYQKFLIFVNSLLRVL